MLAMATKRPNLTPQGQNSLDMLKGRRRAVNKVNPLDHVEFSESVLNEALGEYEVNLKIIEDEEQGDSEVH